MRRAEENMKTSTELQEILRRIDRKGYPAYKETRGQYRFERYVLSIDHVQGDPFASPSKVSVRISGKEAGFEQELYDTYGKRVALQDHLLRKFSAVVEKYSFQAGGSGKSGLIAVTRPGQEILNRSACVIQAGTGDLIVRMEIGFPASGRTVLAGKLEKILFEFLPECVRKTLYRRVYKTEELEQVMHLAVDQQFIREQMKKRKLTAFVANGSILPRKSGVSMLPMKDAIPFQSPESMEVTLDLPYYGTIKGMGIPCGFTLIVGGGYHGKSTLLKALELGVYNHIAGDGREYVITDDSAMKIRAEDGRSIRKADISMFIQNLPNKKDTAAFYTEDASGSTSQAANTIEAMESGSRLLLIDEDTSATNFMIRDELMQRVVHRDQEPIIPFIDRVRELYEIYGISTILVVGSSGAYFSKADWIIQMNQYRPAEITEFAKTEAACYHMDLETAAERKDPCYDRVVLRDADFLKEDRIKTKVMGKESILINREAIDLRLVEQLTDTGQLSALAQILIYLKRHVFDGRRTVTEAVNLLMKKIETDEFSAFCEGQPGGNLTIPRKQEIHAALNRCRNLVHIK